MVCRGVNVVICNTINPYPSKKMYLKFQPLEVVSRYRDPQFQVVEKYSYLSNLGQDINKN